MNCSHCKAAIPGDSTFCPECGKPVTPAAKSSGHATPAPKDGLKLISIGRNPKNVIVIGVPSVSSFHAVMKVQGGVFTIEDQNSSNGTFVNGKRVVSQTVTKADTITFGEKYQFDWSLLDKILSVDSAGAVELEQQFKGKNIIAIGRDKSNDIVLQNIKVSRKHARIIREGDEWSIEDLGSGNGTFVNGEKVTRSKIRLSDNITIGGIPLSLRNLFTDLTDEVIGETRLSCSNLSFKVKDNGNEKVIIDDVSLTFNSGEFVGLIGPSGAGKTTLMMMLNGSNPPSNGDVYINNQSLFANLNSFKGTLGYVPQDDIIHRELTVEESFKFTAKLRLGGTASDEEMNETIDKVINDLQLGHTRTTLIGSPEKKGISGGQRKRVNLGQELLTEPNILFLDEPTSGLDPKTDTDVMNLLRGIANKGKIIVLTTHAITAKNFNIMTHLVVLTQGGKLAYFGPSKEACAYFGVNEPEEIFDELKKQENNAWKEKYRKSSYFEKFVAQRADSVTIEKKGKGPEKIQKQEKDSAFAQFLTLTNRYMKIKMRDVTNTVILLAQAPIVALIISFVLNEADQRTQALLLLIVAAIFLGTQNAARELVSEQAIYKRERMVGLRITSYLFSKVVVLLIIGVIQAGLLTGITSGLVSFNMPIYEMFGLLTITASAATLMGLLLSASVRTNEAALGLVPIVVIPQIILSGGMVSYSKLSEVMQQIANATISRWGFESMMIAEFDGIADSGADPIVKCIGGVEQTILLTGNDLIKNIGFLTENFWGDLGAQAIIFVVFLLTTIFIVKKRHG